MYWLTCILVFVATYTLNLLYVSVFYHRALTHGSVQLHPWMRKFVIFSGSWVTGLDPKGWSCMHRLHHTHSDTEKDPHSPMHHGVMPVAYAQLKAYKLTLAGLIGRKSYYTSVVKDLDFPVHWLNRKQLWFLPYLLQATIAIAIAMVFNAWILALCYWVGMMSHPLQGWMVNALAHRFGYRNFETNDNSRNNTLVSWLVFGEGFQNNHHQSPQSANFAVKWWEVDLGYGLCCMMRAFGVLRFTKT